MGEDKVTKQLLIMCS